MAAYVLVDNKINDPDGYAEYLQLVSTTVEKYRGQYLVRGGTIPYHDSNWLPERLVMIRFESTKQALAWIKAPELAAIHNMRKKYATSKMILVEGCSETQA